MIIPKGKTIYIGGRKFGPGSDCPDNLLDDKQKEKLKKHDKRKKLKKIKNNGCITGTGRKRFTNNA